MKRAHQKEGIGRGKALTNDGENIVELSAAD
jgi:hypothetical protein